MRLLILLGQYFTMKCYYSLIVFQQFFQYFTIHQMASQYAIIHLVTYGCKVLPRKWKCKLFFDCCVCLHLYLFDTLSNLILQQCIKLLKQNSCFSTLIVRAVFINSSYPSLMRWLDQIL